MWSWPCRKKWKTSSQPSWNRGSYWSFPICFSDGLNVYILLVFFCWISYINISAVDSQERLDYEIISMMMMIHWVASGLFSIEVFFKYKVQKWEIFRSNFSLSKTQLKPWKNQTFPGTCFFQKWRWKCTTWALSQIGKMQNGPTCSLQFIIRTNCHPSQPCNVSQCSAARIHFWGYVPNLKDKQTVR